MVALALTVSIAALAPILYIVCEQNVDASFSELAVATAYPIGDAIILVPAMIGVMLFFRGKVNLLWSLMCLAIIFETIADTGFLLTTFDDSYYQGHPIDILFIWYYVIFSFGVYSHITIFRNHKQDPYKNIQELR